MQPCPPNKLGITDPELFSQIEATITGLAVAEILRGDAVLPEAHGTERLTRIHGHIFGELFDHAGRIRRTPLGKAEFEDSPPSNVTHFVPPLNIRRDLGELFEHLRRDAGFKGYGRMAFTEKAADFLAELNAIHPFEEGNGRTQRTYLSLLAHDAGYRLRFEGVTSERMIAASIAATRSDSTPLRGLIDEVLDPVRGPLLRLVYSKLAPKLGELDQRDFATTMPGTHYRGHFALEDGEHFLFGTSTAIRIGNLADLGNSMPENGAAIDFFAGYTPSQQAHHWIDEVEQAAQRGGLVASIEAGYATLEAENPLHPAILAALPDRLTAARQIDELYQARGRDNRRDDPPI